MSGNRVQVKERRPGKGWSAVATAAFVLLLMSPRAGWGTVVMNSPLFEAKDLAGGDHSLADLMKNGKTTIVFFWALRCAPCLREMAALDEIYRARRDHGLEVLAVEAAGSSPQKIEAILDQLKDVVITPSYPVLPDPEFYLNRKFSVRVAPWTFVVNSLGEIVYSFEGFSGELKDKLTSGVDALLSGKAFPANSTVPEDTAAAALSVADRPSEEQAGLSENSATALVEDEFEKNRYFGDFYFHREEYDKALGFYAKGLQLKPENIYIRLKSGEAYAKKKMYAEAREAWEYILRISPGNADADANLRRLLRQEF